MHNKSISELALGLANKEYSSEELTQMFLNRSKQHQVLNCFITLDTEKALAQAKQADKRIAQGDGGFLTGIPVAQKDIFCSKDIKTSCGSKMLDNFIAPYDATVIAKFNAAGAVMLGKLNMDEFAMGSSTETSFYGAVKNPWDLNTVPGGSSGGSASAVAARLTPAATGTDTGGSIRQPASLCGITGLKPTYGRVSRYGMVAFASSLDQGGPMARSAEDVALLMQVMAGFDLRDSTSVDQPVPNYAAALNNNLEGLKIGLPKQFFSDDLPADIATTIEYAINEYKKLGAKIKQVSLPHQNLVIPVYYIIAPSECSANLARFDGVRFGYRCDNPKNLTDLYLRSRSEGFGVEVKRRILIGTYALSSGYYDAYYLQAQKIRRLISDDFRQAFKEVDVLMGPVSPSIAFNAGEKTNDPIAMYQSDIYTIGSNLAGIPAMSIPVGLVANKPVGLQIIGNYFTEQKLLNIAHCLQQVTDWHTRIPEGFA